MYALSSTHASPAHTAAMRSRCTAAGTSTQPGSQVRSSTAWYGRPVRPAIARARVDLPEPVTP